MAEFWVVRDGERIGPFAEAEILRSYESGALQGADLLWAEGMASGATVAETFAQLRKEILTSSQQLALEEIAPPPDSAVPPHASPPADVAVPAERSRTAAGGPKRGWRVALAVLIALALAFAAFHFLA
jgi:GYF domain 2